MKDDATPLSRLHATLCPRALLIRAIVLAGLFAAAHLAGWREYTSVLCGTNPGAGDAPSVAAWLGVVYLVCYGLAVVAAPVLAIGATLSWIWEKITLQEDDT